MCMHVCKGYGLPGRRVGLHGHWLLAMGALLVGIGCFALHWALAYGRIWPQINMGLSLSSQGTGGIVER